MKREEDTYTNVTVHHQAHAEQTVKDGVVGAACDERGDSEGDKAGGEDALECPVVRAVRFRGSREGRGVVHGAPVDRCTQSVSKRHKTQGGGCTYDRRGHMQRPPHLLLQ